MEKFTDKNTFIKLFNQRGTLLNNKTGDASCWKILPHTGAMDYFIQNQLAFIQKFIKEIDSGRLSRSIGSFDPIQKPLPLSSAIDKYLQTVTINKAKETQTLDEYYFRRFYKFLNQDIDVKEIGLEHLESFQSHLKYLGLKPKSGHFWTPKLKVNTTASVHELSYVIIFT